MALVNLLPWREELRQERQKEFLGILMLVLLLTAVAAFSWHTVVQGNIETQRDRNKLLQNGIAQLENDLQEINKLEKTKQLWLARMEIIQGLQSNRAEVVKVFEQLARAIPDGAFLSEANLVGESNLSIVGFSESNARVSALMRQLDASSKFEKCGSLSIEKDETLGEDGARFEFRAVVIQPGVLGDVDISTGGNN